jgi:PAS domain S-box-containing protein
MHPDPNAPAQAALIDRLLDAIGEGAWDWDVRTGIVRHNAAWTRLLGVQGTMRAHRAEAFLPLVHPDDRTALLERVRHALATGEMRHHEYRIVRPDGRMLWVADRGAAVEHDAAGVPVRFVGSLRDISAERDRRLALAESEQRLQLALRAGDMGLWDWNYTSGALVVNTRWKTMLGLAPDAPVHRIDDWAPHVHPDDVPLLDAVIRDVIEGPAGSDFTVEIRARHAQGHWIWILDQGVVAERAPDGRPLRVTGIHQDITERKQTERMLRAQREQLGTVIDSAMDAMVSIDAAQRVVVFNRAAERMFGVPAGEVLGGPFDRFLPPAMRAGHAARMDRFAHAGSQRRLASDGEATMARRADGSTFPIEASISRSGEGDGVLFTAIIRDVSEVHRARDALLEKERAEQANAAKSAFLSKVSHELRTPLNAILGFADLMHSADPTDARRHAELIAQAGRRLLALVNDLLDLSRIEGGALALAPQPLAVPRALRQAAAVLQPEATRRGLALVLEPPPFGTVVQADPRALDQILLNLGSNALKFAPAGGVVRLSAAALDDGRIAIDVEDNGPGIPAERQGELFKPYSRLGVPDRQVPGTGLGLAISLQLARGMGGDIAVFSRAGAGTRMSLRLPAAPAGPAPDDTTPTPLDELPEAPAGLAALRRVLIVEDDPASALLMEQVCRIGGGWRVQVAATLARALEIVGRERFDLVLTDIDVDGCDGVELIRVLHAAPCRADTTVIAVSADAMGPQAERALAAGADGYWVKPVEPRRVIAFLRASRADWPALLAAE